jgi:glycosyltransferase involved in cell wall biosynthesis
MACGLPVVASSVGCLPDIVAEGETGFLVPHSTPEVLADRICRLLADPDIRRRMGAAARMRVEERFDEQGVVDRLEGLYLEVLGDGST